MRRRKLKTDKYNICMGGKDDYIFNANWNLGTDIRHQRKKARGRESKNRLIGQPSSLPGFHWLPLFAEVHCSLYQKCSVGRDGDLRDRIGGHKNEHGEVPLRLEREGLGSGILSRDPLSMFPLPSSLIVIRWWGYCLKSANDSYSKLQCKKCFLFHLSHESSSRLYTFD